jgi:hypothetical protein
LLDPRCYDALSLVIFPLHRIFHVNVAPQTVSGMIHKLTAVVDTGGIHDILAFYGCESRFEDRS